MSFPGITRTISLLIVSVFLLSSFLLQPEAALAQNPHLSGAWVLNEAESRMPDDGRTDGIRTYIPASEITIGANGEDLKFEYKLPRLGQRRGGRREYSTSVRVYTADGEFHTTVVDGDTVKTCAEWKEGKLVISRERIRYLGMSKSVFRGTTEYSLSEDGSRLIMEDLLRGPDRSPVRARVVYDRKKP